MSNKTLDEYMHELGEDEIVSIGAKSQYFLVGTKEDYERDIDVISEMLKNNAQEKLTSSINSINRIKEGFEYEERMDLFEYAERLINAGRELKRVMAIKANTEEAIRTYKPMREREVIDVFKRITEDTTSVIVSGYELGSFWSREEYVKARAEGRYTALWEKEKEADEY